MDEAPHDLQAQIDELRARLLELEDTIRTAGAHRIRCPHCEKMTPAFRRARYARFFPAEIKCWECGGLYDRVTIRDRLRVRLTGSDWWRWRSDLEQREQELAPEGD